MVSISAPQYTVVEFTTCFLVRETASGDETVVSKPEPEPQRFSERGGPRGDLREVSND